MTRRAPGERFWRMAFRLAMWLLPRELRECRGLEMEACFDDRLRAAGSRGGLARARAGLLELTDVAATAARLRLERLRRRSSTTRRRKTMDLLWQDVRYAVRGWLRRPAFSLVAVLTLALGIGANTAMFSVADAVLFRPLPHEDPDRLAMVWAVIPGLDWERAPISYPNYRDVREGTRAFEDLAAFTNAAPVTVAGDGAPERVARSHVSANLFDVLGNRALLGRTLHATDDERGAEPVVVVGEEYWRTRLGGDPDALGRVIRIEDQPHVVVGVMPAGFAFPQRTAQLWTALGPTAVDLARDLQFLQMIGRLAPGATVASAERDVGAVIARLGELYPAEAEGMRLWVEPRHAFVVGDSGTILFVLLGAVALVLVIACANLANLMLARGAARGRELAVRAALGAGRGRIIRQLLTESALLGVLGGVVGAALAVAALRLIGSLAPLALPRGETIGMDGRALLFAGALAVASGVLVGIVPALRARAAGDVLREGGRSGTAGRSRQRLQRSLVVTQVALALVLLAGAGLLVNSLARLLGVDPGFRPEGVLAVYVSLPEARYPEDEDVGLFFDELIERASALPGVQHAGATWSLPFTGMWASGGAAPEGRIAGTEPLVVGMLPVRGDVLRALGMRLIAGRWYGDADRNPDAGVVVVNQTFARQFWPGEDAVGKRFRRGRPEEERPWQTVIGVTADVTRADLGAPAQAEAYFLHSHPEGSWANDMHLVVRTAGDPLALAAPIRSIVSELDQELALGTVQTIPDLMARSAAGPRIRTLLASSFAGLAALLAVVGIYGVMAFAVAERRREIGVRMALGARQGTVLGDVLRQGAALTAAGLVLGLGGAAAATRLLGSMLFAVDPLDIPTYGAATALLAAAALAACWIPARRASRVDPLTALRDE